MAAAAALAAGGIPEVALSFDEDDVGPFGAGYAWLSDAAVGSPDFQATGSDSDSEAGDFTRVRPERTRFPQWPCNVGTAGGCRSHADPVRCTTVQDAPAVEEAGPDEGGQPADQFKREVAETFLRCIKEAISHDNAVIELNGLKIAEDRAFADCARCGFRGKGWRCCLHSRSATLPSTRCRRYMFTTMLGLCLPAGPATRPEYRPLYAKAYQDPRSKEGRLELLRKINAQLRAWKDLLHRFLKSNDDQASQALEGSPPGLKEAQKIQLPPSSCTCQLRPSTFSAAGRAPTHI